MRAFIDVFLHVDRYVAVLTQQYGFWTYGILFLVIFCETGLVFTPFLPGDSLLFAAGALAGIGTLQIELLLPLLIAAAIVGDTVNYWIGRETGERLLKHPRLSAWIKAEHIDRTKAFYAKHGSKMILFARFFPIIRTFAPFVAGMSAMPYRTFLLYNIIGGVIWVLLFTLGGYFFGNVPAVKDNFTLVVIGIILVSLIPAFIGFLKRKTA